MVKTMGLKSYPRIYFELLLSNFTTITSMSLPSAFLPLFAAELDPLGLLIGFVVSAWFLSRIFIELPSGLLANQFGRRRLLIYGLATSAMGVFLCFIANHILLLIVGRALWGLGVALYFISSSAIIMSVFTPDTRGQAWGIFLGLEFIGSFIGTPIGGFLSPVIGYRGVFFLAFTFTLCALLTVFISADIRKIDLKSAPLSKFSLIASLQSLKKWGVVVICISSFSAMLISGGIISTVFPLFLNKNLNIDVDLIGIIFSTRTLGFITATLISGYLSRIFRRKILINLGCVVESVFLLSYAFISSLEAFILVGFIEGFGSGIIWSSLLVLLSDIVPENLIGGAIGMYRTFMDIGGLIGPLLFMEVFYRTGCITTFFLASAVLLLNAALTSTIKYR
jgi:DHA1 family multidrug resistance protein-like MFS transporter